MSIAVVLPARIDLASTKKNRLSFHLRCRASTATASFLSGAEIGRAFQPRDLLVALAGLVQAFGL
jgi:hypothetical protein